MNLMHEVEHDLSIALHIALWTLLAIGGGGFLAFTVLMIRHLVHS